MKAEVDVLQLISGRDQGAAPASHLRFLSRNSCRCCPLTCRTRKSASNYTSPRTRSRLRRTRRTASLASQHAAKRSTAHVNSAWTPCSNRRAGWPRRQKMAMGLTGEPVPARRRRGAMTQRNDQRSSSSHTATRSSSCSQSRRCSPIALMASTCTGKATPSAALGAVSLLPSLPSTAIRRSARSSTAAGCSPARAAAESQGPTALRRLR